MRYRSLCKLIAVKMILAFAFFFMATTDICIAQEFGGLFSSKGRQVVVNFRLSI